MTKGDFVVSLIAINIPYSKLRTVVMGSGKLHREQNEQTHTEIQPFKLVRVLLINTTEMRLDFTA